VREKESGVKPPHSKTPPSIRRNVVGRWPDKSRSALMTFVLIFVLFPLLCFLCWWFVYH
jgi:hypothetical protein